MNEEQTEAIEQLKVWRRSVKKQYERVAQMRADLTLEERALEKARMGLEDAVRASERANLRADGILT